MAHYAFITDGIVTEVITGIDETQTIRFNFAGIGMTYDQGRDAFIAPKSNCHAEEVLDEATCRWSCANAEHNDPKP